MFLFCFCPFNITIITIPVKLEIISRSCTAAVIKLNLAKIWNLLRFLLVGPGALSLAITHPQFYWYVDETLTPDSLHSSLLRSEIHFGAPLPSFYSLQDRPMEQRRRFRDFVVQYAEILAQQSTRLDTDYYQSGSLLTECVRRKSSSLRMGLDQ